MLGEEWREFAMAVDIEMDLYLVPKQWVKEVVQQKIGNYASAFAI